MTSANCATSDDIAAWLVTTCEELGLHGISVGHDFFAFGGTSMLAIKLIAKIETTFGEDILPPSDLFTIRQLEGVAQALGRAMGMPA